MIKLIPLLILSFSTLLSASIGEISAINGSAIIHRGAQTLTVTMHMPIEEKDVIQTAKKGKLQIVFKDNTVISLGQNSTFKIQEYLYGEKKVKARFNVKGLFKSITGKIGHIAPKNFTLKTQNATIGVRGTTIIGESNQEKDTIICSSGKIIVYSPKGMQIVQQGEKTVILKGHKPTAAVPVSKEVIQKSQKHIVPSKPAITTTLLPQKEQIISEVEKENITTVKEDWGQWNSSEDITKETPLPTTEEKEDQLPQVEEKRADLALLRQKAGNDNPSYHGNVSGFVDTPMQKISQVNNHINLNVDLGRGVINGDMGFDAANERWETTIKDGHVDKHGAIDFALSNQNNLHGKANGALSGERLEHVNGTFHIQNEQNSHTAYGTFKARKE